MNQRKARQQKIAANRPSKAAAAKGAWDDPPSVSASVPTPGAVMFVVAACLVCLGYALYTAQVWEDSLITLRHSENLLKGEGLTFNRGERVYGFTSPINVLLLALCHLLTGQTSYVATCWLYRLFTIAAFAASGVLLLKSLDEVARRWLPAIWFAAIVFLFDVKNVAFSINGMETAFMLLFVVDAIYLCSRGETGRWLQRGLCWGGLMWTRPDGFVYIGALALGELVFLSPSRRATLVSLAKSAAVCLIVYCPWLLWTWWYYGSPIPHTIIAKSNLEQGPLGQALTAFDRWPASLISIAAQAFRPIYYGDQLGWWSDLVSGMVIGALTKFVGIVALVYFMCPVKDRFGRAMSLSFAVLCSYFSYMTAVYPWYYPPATLFGLVAFVRAATTVAAGDDRLNEMAAVRRKRIVIGLFAILAAGAVALFLAASREERVQQAVIELGNRAAIGTWLKEHGKPTDTVYLEPLGYIGYFSEMHMHDYPGLVSPEVVQLRRELSASESSFKAGRYLIISQLKPDWVVLRALEAETLATLPVFESFRKGYTLVKKFDVTERLRQYDPMPGRNSLLFDADYGVFRRNDQSP